MRTRGAAASKWRSEKNGEFDPHAGARPPVGEAKIWKCGEGRMIQGQGWIGWGPHAPAVAGVVQRTRTFVTINTFANGNPISPADFIAVPPSQLTQVSTPQLAPAWTAALPGPTLPQLSQSSPVQAGASAEPAGNLRGLIGSSGGAAPAPTVVFDPADGRFVNNPAAEGRSIAPSAPTDAMRRPAPRSVWGASDVQGGTEPLRDSAGPERMTIRTRRPIPSAAAPDFTRDTHSVPETNPATSPAAAPAHGTTPNSSAWGTSSSSASAAAPPSSAPATPAGGSGATSHGGAFGAAPARETPNDASGAKGQGPARNE